MRPAASGGRYKRERNSVAILCFLFVPWQKEHRGLLMHATDLYKPEINYIQLFADKEAIQNSEDDTDSEDIPL